jgi:hypothetical protein
MPLSFTNGPIITVLSASLLGPLSVEASNLAVEARRAFSGTMRPPLPRMAATGRRSPRIRRYKGRHVVGAEHKRGQRKIRS